MQTGGDTPTIRTTMSEPVFGKKPSADSASDIEGEEDLPLQTAKAALPRDESFYEIESADAEEESLPQEDAPPLEAAWEASPAMPPSAPATPAASEDIWGSPAPMPVISPASNRQVPQQEMQENKPVKEPSLKPKTPSVGKAPWEEDDEEEPLQEETPVTAFSSDEEDSDEEELHTDESETPLERGDGPKLSIPEHLRMEETPEETEEDITEEAVELPPPPPPPPPAYAPPPREEPQLSEVQQLLLTIVEDHHLWLGSAGKQGQRAIITGHQLRGADFSGLYLAEASFRHADLPAALFQGANLERADFSEANLQSADFSGAMLHQANFQRAQLGLADFTDAQANEADFTAAELVGATFIRTQLEWGVFCDALLGEADLRLANLEKANLRSASLFRARLEGANLSQADCRDANFDQAQLDDAVLQQTNLKGSHLKGNEIQQTDFSQAESVPIEAIEDTLTQEREWLQQEATRLEKLRIALEYREQQLEAAQMAEPQAFQNPAPAREERIYARATSANAIDNGYLEQLLRKHGKLFMKLGIVWLVVALLVLSISLSAFEVMDSSQLNFIELLLFAFIFFAPPGLCLMAMIKSNKLAQTLQQMSQEAE
jgi:uncharacterized protein YjbI with pentapeptide repeats